MNGTSTVQVSQCSTDTISLEVNLRTGLCFSGGGSRALTVTMGVLRALESLKLIPHVDAISSVSGGTWASSIYMFAKDVSIKDRSFPLNRI